jgi:hypothetical protein
MVEKPAAKRKYSLATDLKFLIKKCKSGTRGFHARKED